MILDDDSRMIMEVGIMPNDQIEVIPPVKLGLIRELSKFFEFISDENFAGNVNELFRANVKRFGFHEANMFVRLAELARVKRTKINRLLITAIVARNVECVRALVLHCDTQINNREKSVFASVKNNIEIAKILVDNGIDIEYSPSEYTPLMYACLCGHTRLVKFLIKRGADVNRCTRRGNAITAAIDGDSIESLETLLSHNANPNNHGLAVSALSFAIDCHSMQMARLLLEDGAIVDQGVIVHVNRLSDTFRDEFMGLIVQET